jgi:hypothetical protein
VWRDVCEVLSAPEMIAHAMGRARGGHWLPQEMQARRANLRRGRTALAQQVERLTEAYLAGVLPLAECERRRRDVEARLAALDRQEHSLTHDAQCQDETAQSAAHAEAFCQRVCEGLATADFDRKRALLELLVDRVIVTDGEVEIRYVVPTGPDGERHPFCRSQTDHLHRFRRWSVRGWWELVFEPLRPALPGDRLVLLDSTTCKAHRAASGAARSNAEAECLGRSRGGICSKSGEPLGSTLHACADGAGRIPRLVPSPGQHSGLRRAPALVSSRKSPCDFAGIDAMQGEHSFGRVEANALKVYADGPSGSDVDNQTLAHDAAGPSTSTRIGSVALQVRPA